MSFSEFGNPILTERSFQNGRGARGGRMSRGGVVGWLVALILIMLGTGAYTWNKAFQAFGDFNWDTVQSVDSGRVDKDGDPITVQMVVDPETGERSPLPEFEGLAPVAKLMWIGLIAGFITSMIIIFNQRTAPFLAPVYAACEGLALGGVSANYELQLHGIAMLCMALSVLVLLGCVGLYAAGLFRKASGTLNVLLVLMVVGIGIYVADIVAQGVTGSGFGIIHGHGWMAIAFSLFMIGLAIWNFFIDFETIDNGIEGGAESYMNAYCAFGVLLTLVWLYLEMLRLAIIIFGKKKSRSNFRKEFTQRFALRKRELLAPAPATN